MSRLADVKNMNESIVQGDIYEKQKNLTLGTFKSLQGNDNKTIYKSIETFLSDSLQTDGDDEQVGDDETYSDLTLSELYSIYKDKVELLEAELETLNNLDNESLYSSSGVFNYNDKKYFYTQDGDGEFSFQNLWKGNDAMNEKAAEDDSLTDSEKFPDSINLTCGLMAETNDVDDFGEQVPTQETYELAKTDAVCNPFSNGADNFSKAILYITQLNEIVSQMKSKANGSDDSLNIDDLDKSLKDYQARYNFMLKYKTSSAVAASNSDDISNKPGSLRDSSSGYLEAETLKYDSAKMLYVSLLLGSVVAGAITVSTIINSNN